MHNANIIEISSLSVQFGGVSALSNVTLGFRRGYTSGIIGPNGAGKTTLFNCISGFILPLSGARILLEGEQLVGRRVDRIARLGLSRTFQNISLNRSLSVRDNILTGLHTTLAYGPLSALFPTPRVWRMEADAVQAVDRTAELLGLSKKTLESRVDSLPLGLQKKVEVARAIVRKPRVLLLDEPAGGLNDVETAELMASLRTLARQPDLSIVLIDHDMSLVMPLCDHVCVLDFGKVIAQGTPAEIARNPDVIASYLGTDDDA